MNMTDTELAELIRKWWNNADEYTRRWAIYYSLEDIDDYSYVWFVARNLEIPGFNPEHYTNEQRDFCAHVCEVLKNMTRKLILQSL